MDIVNWNLAGPCTYCKYGARDSEVRADKVRIINSSYNTNHTCVCIHFSVLCLLSAYESPPQAQLTRYRELYKILTDTVPGADYSQMPYDELCEWCVGEMEPVFR